MHVVAFDATLPVSYSLAILVQFGDLAMTGSQKVVSNSKAGGDHVVSQTLPSE